MRPEDEGEELVTPFDAVRLTELLEAAREAEELRTLLDSARLAELLEARWLELGALERELETLKQVPKEDWQPLVALQ